MKPLLSVGHDAKTIKGEKKGYLTVLRGVK